MPVTEQQGEKEAKPLPRGEGTCVGNLTAAATGGRIRVAGGILRSGMVNTPGPPGLASWEPGGAGPSPAARTWGKANPAASLEKLIFGQRGDVAR